MNFFARNVVKHRRRRRGIHFWCCFWMVVRARLRPIIHRLIGNRLVRYHSPGGILEILFRNGTTGPLNKSSTRYGLGRRVLIPQLREVEDESGRIASFVSTTSTKSKETVGNILQESSIFLKVQIVTTLLKTFNYTPLWEKGPEMDVSVFRLKACQALEKFVIQRQQTGSSVSANAVQNP